MRGRVTVPGTPTAPAPVQRHGPRDSAGGRRTTRSGARAAAGVTGADREAAFGHGAMLEALRGRGLPFPLPSEPNFSDTLPPYSVLDPLIETLTRRQVGERAGQTQPGIGRGGLCTDTSHCPPHRPVVPGQKQPDVALVVNDGPSTHEINVDLSRYAAARSWRRRRVASRRSRPT